MSKKNKSLTKAEEDIMQILWQLEKANVAAIIAQLSSPKPAYNTVSTIVRILESKGFVGYEKQGRGHLYYPLISKDEYSYQTLQKLKDNYFKGSIKQMVSFFVNNNDISIKELESILKEINHKKE
jgi:predicted transcriptional regulator